MSEPFVMKAVVSIAILALGALVLWANQTGESDLPADKNKLDGDGNTK